MPSGAVAPGADDNASGTTAVIEAARLMSGINLPFTILFAAWDEEDGDFSEAKLMLIRRISAVIQL
ncbi:MAG: M28 family peptidase [Ignavibacteria bacterium]|nr:M28 family peptidase [Ignavibacteria bacterium]